MQIMIHNQLLSTLLLLIFLNNNYKVFITTSNSQCSRQLYYVSVINPLHAYGSVHAYCIISSCHICLNGWASSDASDFS